MRGTAESSQKTGLLRGADIRSQFPFFAQDKPGGTLHYLDNAATSQKPYSVIDAVARFYKEACGPAHRGLYPLAEEATARYEHSRTRLAEFIGATSADQVIFTRSTTESINMVASGWAPHVLKPGDRVYVTRMEHHSNLLPWQRACRNAGAELRFIPLRKDGTLDVGSDPELFDDRTGLIALCHVSNVLGTLNSVEKITEEAKRKNIPVLVDAAQSAAHIELDVNELGCDFLALSAHKMCGPTGVGLLYARPERLADMEPLLLGGGMVDQVDDTQSTWTSIPARFEAGSPNIAGAIGFAAAADFIEGIGMDAVEEHVRELTNQAVHALHRMDGIEIYGSPLSPDHTAIVSFNVAGIHPHDVAQVAGEQGVALRAGHHCCQPLMKDLGVAATVRASFAAYNQVEDVDALVEAIRMACRLFQPGSA